MRASINPQLALCCALFGGLCLSGCASTPVATSVSGTPAAFSGLPFRIHAQQTARVFVRQYDGNYTEVSRAAAMLTDFNRTFALDVHSGPLASPSLTLQMNSDNTLKSVEIAGTDQTPATLDAATSAVSGVQTLDKARATDRLTHAQAVVTANNAVVTAQAALVALPATASPQTKQIYQDALDAAKGAAAVAQEQANQ